MKVKEPEIASNVKRLQKWLADNKHLEGTAFYGIKFRDLQYYNNLTSK